MSGNLENVPSKYDHCDCSVGESDLSFCYWVRHEFGKANEEVTLHYQGHCVQHFDVVELSRLHRLAGAGVVKASEPSENVGQDQELVIGFVEGSDCGDHQSLQTENTCVEQD